MSFWISEVQKIGRFFVRALFVCILIFIMSYSAFAQSTLPRATVWLYRPDTDNSNLPLTLHMDGRKLTTLGMGQFFGIQVSSGLHAFSWTTAPGAQQVVIPIGPDPQA